jgi:membrane-associated phospholipid phosphatase
LLLELNTRIPVQKIIWASELCAKWDRYVFGVNLPFWMQDKNNSLRWLFDFFSSAMILAYSFLMLVFSVALSLSLMKNFSLFVRFLFAFTVVIFISFPVWYLVPAYTPMDMYINNYLSHTPPPSIQKSLDDYRPAGSLAIFFEEIKEAHSYSSEGVSSFPSMHVAWSIIIFYFCLKIWKPLAFFTVPYVLLNGMATIFTLEHYGVDVIAGIVAAIGAIFLSGLIKHSDNGKEITYLIRKKLLNTYEIYKEGFILIGESLKK